MIILEDARKELVRVSLPVSTSSSSSVAPPRRLSDIVLAVGHKKISLAGMWSGRWRRDRSGGKERGGDGGAGKEIC